MKYRPWNTTEAALARALRAQGHSCPEIGRRLGRTAGSVSGFLCNRYVPKRKPKAERRSRAKPQQLDASERLRRAIIAAIANHANSNSIPIDTAAAQLLSGAG